MPRLPRARHLTVMSLACCTECMEWVWPRMTTSHCGCGMAPSTSTSTSPAEEIAQKRQSHRCRSRCRVRGNGPAPRRWRCALGGQTCATIRRPPRFVQDPDPTRCSTRAHVRTCFCENPQASAPRRLTRHAVGQCEHLAVLIKRLHSRSIHGRAAAIFWHESLPPPPPPSPPPPPLKSLHGN